jgi:pimeloyl-ACP methyl ester carboxylesterase
MAYRRIGGNLMFEEVLGAGEPVLMLHGGFCSLESLRPIGESLAREHSVYSFERPGHGRSSDVDRAYHYDHDAADAVAYLDDQGLETVHVVGYSDGAIIGLLLALEHPERVRSLVAISANLDPGAFTMSPGADDARVLAPLPPLSTSTSPEPDEERTVYERLSPDGPEHADVVLEKLMRLWTEEPRIDPAALATVTSPVLVMSGDRDTIRPDHSLLIAASLPHAPAQLAILPGTSHALVAEKPNLISQLVREFLVDVERRGSADADR